ncbi:MAG TPA: cupin domain-containing protein [Gemmatimonadota bacterium]|jgi:quercetin dioxygenase-like cupin family protein
MTRIPTGSLVMAATLCAAIGCQPQQAVHAPLGLGGPGAIIAPHEGLAPPPFDDGRSMLLKVGPTLSNSTHLFLAAEDMPPGTAIPVHRHEVHEEVLFVHRGQVAILLGEREAVAPAGSTVYIPAGTWIGVHNTGRDTATVIGVFAQAEVEACFTRLARHLTPADSATLERRCQMTFLSDAR